LGYKKENVDDAKRHGTWAQSFEQLVAKYGEEYARERLKRVPDPVKARHW
jgi:hypothetical protein